MILKKTSIRLKIRSINLQFPASAYQEMEDAQVGDREQKAATDRTKGTRTTAMTIQVYPGCLSTRRIALRKKN